MPLALKAGHLRVQWNMDSRDAPHTAGTLSLSPRAALSHLFLPRSRFCRKSLQKQSHSECQPLLRGKTSPTFWFLSPCSIPAARAGPSLARQLRTLRCVQTSNSLALNCTFNYIY